MNPASRRQRATSPRMTKGQLQQQQVRTASVLAVAASILLSALLSGTPATAGAPPATPGVDAVSTELDAALNDVVAAGVPGIIVRVKDAHRAARNYAAGVGDLATGAALRPAAAVPGRKHHQDLRRHHRAAAGRRRTPHGSTSPSPHGCLACSRTDTRSRCGSS